MRSMSMLVCALRHPDVIGTTGIMSHKAMSLSCAVVKEIVVHNEFVDQLDDDEL